MSGREEIAGAAAMRAAAAKIADREMERHEAEGEGGGREWATASLIAGLIRALPATPRTDAGDGWKLVPVEPTPEMVEAAVGLEISPYRGVHSLDYLAPVDAAPIWSAMIAVAPERAGGAS